MRTIMLLLTVFQFVSPAEAEIALKCADIKPAYREVRTMHMQPRRRGKAWLSGVVKTEFVETCDASGRKTGEAQYTQKNLQLKRRLEYKDRQEAKVLCENRGLEKKARGDGATSLIATFDEFCRDRRKSAFDAVFVYDETSNDDGADAGIFGRIFRVYNDKGLQTEEYFFDPADGLDTRKTYKYDEKSNPAEITVFDAAGSQVKRETFAFDAVAASKSRTVYGRMNEALEKIVSEYREDSTLRRETIYAYDTGGQFLSKKEISASASGAAQKELVYQGDSKKPAYEYHYSYRLDSKGNWKEEKKTRFIFYDGKAMHDKQAAPEITRRKITYSGEEPGRKQELKR